MAYYPTQLPGEVAGVPARRPGDEPAKTPRVWKGVITLVIMALLVGGVTGLGVLEADNLHSVPTSTPAAVLAVSVAGTTALSGVTGPSPATAQPPDQPRG